MTQTQTTTTANNHITKAFLRTGKPTTPLPSRRYFEKSYDPSASLPNGRSYPIPASFEYRANPREQDAV